MNAHVAVDLPCMLGENPLWHPHERKLYWTDISAGKLYRYDPASNATEQCYEGRVVGGFTFQKDGSLLLFRDLGNVVVYKDGQVTKTIIESIPGEENFRFNDVMADPEGRVYCGTLATRNGQPGKLMRLDPDGSIHTLLQGIGCANGMGYTLDNKQMYFTDSGARTIWRFDYDQATGNLTNQQPFIVVPEGQGVPDGMVVDSQGDIWSARWDGQGVFQFDAQGKPKGKIELPAHQVTSVIFAGDDLQEMYITSAGGDDRANLGEYAGALFHCQPGVQGRPEYFSKIQG